MTLGPIVVQKYGGSSVATAEKILAIADRVKKYLETTPHLVVAVSAMGKTTDQLVALARQVSSNPHGRDYDLLLASGEQVAVATLALALEDKAFRDCSHGGPVQHPHGRLVQSREDSVDRLPPGSSRS
jgi:aspartate kinase